MLRSLVGSEMCIRDRALSINSTSLTSSQMIIQVISHTYVTLEPQIKNKIEMVRGMMDCLLAKCVPCILDSVMAELEKLGPKFHLALRLAKDPRFERLPSYLEKGCYADDDIVEYVTVHRCFIVATCDRDLKRRLRKIPGVPIMYIHNRKYTIERMPEAFGAPRV